MRLIDAFVAMTKAEKQESNFPNHEILRIVEGISGTVRIQLEYVPRIFYGKYAPQLKDHKQLGIHFAWKENVFVLLSTLEQSQIEVQNNEQKQIAKLE